MCLAALAIDQHRRFPLVIATNRDELFARPAARLAWWSPGTALPDVLSGRDMQAGGTWMGLTAAGRFALVTNIRRPGSNWRDAPSRGALVPKWLRGDQPSDRFWMGVALSGYNPFNLIAADFRAGECFWASSDRVSPQRIERSLIGLSNAGLDAPWPKVQQLKLRLREAMGQAPNTESLAARLFDALADRTPAPDAELPSTGIPQVLERELSPAFVRTADGSYGTRCSTIVITERIGKRSITQVFERTFSPRGGVALLRRSLLKDWPPKYSLEGNEGPAPTAGPVSEAELPEGAANAVKKRRVRTLLKPTRRAA
jgi:uncharacterized protein with NRDE domain